MSAGEPSARRRRPSWPTGIAQTVHGPGRPRLPVAGLGGAAGRRPAGSHASCGSTTATRSSSCERPWPLVGGVERLRAARPDRRRASPAEATADRLAAVTDAPGATPAWTSSPTDAEIPAATRLRRADPPGGVPARSRRSSRRATGSRSPCRPDATDDGDPGRRSASRPASASTAAERERLVRSRATTRPAGRTIKACSRRPTRPLDEALRRLLLAARVDRRAARLPVRAARRCS